MTLSMQAMQATLALLAAFAPAILIAQTAPSQTAQSKTGKSVLYAAVGSELTQYDLDRNSLTLVRRGSITLPAAVQEAWQHPSRKYLYVAWSNGGASFASFGGAIPQGDRHGISAFRINPVSGALSPYGNPVSLPSRPIYITTDAEGTYVLTAHNNPSGLTVHRILPDGTLGADVPQPASLDFGIYGHQIRVDPSGRTVMLLTRGNGPTAAKPEDPGALKIFSFKNGVLANLLSIAPNGGFGYQIRHLDFHPSGKWAFVTLERQNQMLIYPRSPDGTLGDRPLFVSDTLVDPTNVRPTQTASSIHVDPAGKFVYVANRAYSTVDFEGKPVFAGGENNIAVFSINQETGEPTRIQSADTHGFQPRTFALDSSGGFLVVANQSALSVRNQGGVVSVPASLALFRIHNDGKLEFVSTVARQTTVSNSLFWTGFVALP